MQNGVTVMTEQTKRKPNLVTLENRERLALTGVNDVESFDERCVVAYTDYGQLTVQGAGLNITKLSVESGDLMIDGNIFSLTYTDNRPSENIFRKLA